MKNESAVFILLLLILIPVTIIDIKIKKIPDVFTITGVVVMLILKTLVEKQAIYLSLVLLISGFIPFFLIWFFTKGKLGLGDAKLSAFLALALGIRAWFLMLFLSSIVAILFAVIMLVCKRIDKKTKIPYAPFLSFGALLSIFIT